MTDKREIPSNLKLSPLERSRAIAEYHGSLEFLPSTGSVDRLVETLVLRGFQLAGDSAVRQLSRGAAPIPVEVDIEEFWGAGGDEFATFRLGFGARVKLTAPIRGFRNGRLVSGGSSRGAYYPPIARLFGGPRTSAWRVVIEEGCKELVANIAKALVEETRMQRSPEIGGQK